jgi:hypothetical protein
VGIRAVLEAVEKRKPVVLAIIEPRTSRPSLYRLKHNSRNVYYRKESWLGELLKC